MVYLDKPLFVLSKKEYASGETTIEFIITDNKETSVQMFMTVKDKMFADTFKLGKYYDISFEERANNGE